MNQLRSSGYSSIVVQTHVNIGEGDDPQVTLGSSEATMSSFQVNVDGAFGWVVELITGWFENYLTNALENAVVSAINSSVGYDLGGVVIVKTSCAE